VSDSAKELIKIFSRASAVPEGPVVQPFRAARR